MAQAEQHNFDKILERARELIANEKIKTIKLLAQRLEMDRNTLMQGLDRNFGISSFNQIMTSKAKTKSLVGDEEADSLDVQIDGNFATIRSVVVEGQIKTVEQLLRITNMQDWDVLNPKIKKWDVALKLKTGKDTEVVRVVPSIYIEAPLRAKDPKPFEPIIRPIEIDLPKLPKIKKMGGGCKACFDY